VAVTTITPTEIVRTGRVISLSAANADGSFVPNNGRVYLHVKNGDVSSKTVTVAAQLRPVSGLAIADVTVSVAASAEALIGPFPPEVFNDAAGRLVVSYSAVTSVTVAAYRLP
jgi:hypothetical protein